jgi:hypothetical protein
MLPLSTPLSCKRSAPRHLHRDHGTLIYDEAGKVVRWNLKMDVKKPQLTGYLLDHPKKSSSWIVLQQGNNHHHDLVALMPPRLPICPLCPEDSLGVRERIEWSQSREKNCQAVIKAFETLPKVACFK